MQAISGTVWRGVALTPGGMLRRAIALAVVFALAHLAGWREHTAILCGTLPDAAAAPWCAKYFGAAYVVFYLLATVAAPVLLLAAALLYGWQRWRGDTSVHERIAP